MAERLIMLLAALVAVGATAHAQPLADPTRPPAQEPAQLRQAEPARQRLQSVLISAGRSIAVIDGRPVALGGRVGDATVVSIDPSEVTLQRGAARERLPLLPSVIEKRPVRP
jgi:hypothetical protein